MPCDDGSVEREPIEEAAIRLAAELGRSVEDVMAVLTRVVLTGK